MCEGMDGRGLTPKQRLFVEYYLTHFNASKAAREAGYSARTAHVTGSQNLKNPNIQAAVRARLTDAAMGAEEVLARLADHARGTLADFIEIRKSGRFALDLNKAAAAGKLHLLKELVNDRGNVKIKLHDPQAALVQLGRHHKLFTDQAILSGDPDNPVTLLLQRAAEKAYGDDGD